MDNSGGIDLNLYSPDWVIMIINRKKLATDTDKEEEEEIPPYLKFRVY